MPHPRASLVPTRSPASLYAYAEATRRDVVCVAHVTNTLAVDGDDFEKGADAGTHRILAVVDAIAHSWAATKYVGWSATRGVDR